MAQTKLKIVGGTENLGNEKLRLWLESFVKENQHLPTKILSRTDHIGFSRTGLDAYINGTYFLAEPEGMGVNPKTSSIEKKIRAYRNKIEGTVRKGHSNAFVETRAWQQFQHACKTALEENAIVVIYGRPGLGKTRSRQEYSLRKTTTRPIEILCSANTTTKYFVQKIAKELSLDYKIPLAQLEDNVAEKLKKNPRPIFVDQANYLNEKSLGSICYIWEVAVVPIVLIGTKDLYDLFNTSRMTEDVRTQLTSRIAMHYPLMNLSAGEVNAIVRRALGDKATDEDVAQIFNVTGGVHRHLDMILPRIVSLATKNETELETGKVSMQGIINTAGSRLMVG